MLFYYQSFFFTKWLIADNSFYLVFLLILVFSALTELVFYTQTFIELADDSLIIQRKGLFNLVNEKHKIELKNIQSTYYKKRIYDSSELFHRFFLELFFPSGQSFFIVNLTNGKTKEILFNGNETELMKIKNKLPDRIPN